MDQTTRRRFVSRFGAAMAVLGGGETVALAQAPARGRTARTPFRPARHTQDDWLEQIPGEHRIIIDATTARGAGEAVLFAANLYETNASAYQLKDGDLALVICMRHFATPFAYNDAFWAKYGRVLSGFVGGFEDPKTKQPPTSNLYNSKAYGMQLPSLGNSLADVLHRGARVAICDVASHAMVGAIGGATHASPERVYAEAKGMTVPDSRFVSAGVVAVTRAQERGYALIYAG